MNSQIQTKVLKTMIVLSLFALAACGSSKDTSGTTDSSSRSVTSTGTTNITSSSKAMNYCNRGTSSNFDLNLMVYSNGGQIDLSLLNAKFSKFASIESDSSIIYVWKWKANSNSVYVNDQVPVKFRILNSNNEVILSGLNYLRWADLKTIASKMGVSTAQDFFANVRVVMDLNDPSGEYDAITLAHYDSSNNIKESMKMLIPAFYANPKNYAIDSDGTARNSNLASLHPFKSVSGWDNDEKHFQALANDLCSVWN